MITVSVGGAMTAQVIFVDKGSINTGDDVYHYEISVCKILPNVFSYKALYLVEETAYMEYTDQILFSCAGIIDATTDGNAIRHAIQRADDMREDGKKLVSVPVQTSTADIPF